MGDKTVVLGQAIVGYGEKGDEWTGDADEADRLIAGQFATEVLDAEPEPEAPVETEKPKAARSTQAGQLSGDAEAVTS